MADLEQIAKDSKASQGHDELLWLLNKLSKIKPKIIVEIGVHLGYSLDVWQEAFEPEQLYGIDIDLDDKAALEIALRAKAYISNSDSHSEFALNKLKEILEGRPIDFLFIDGDHTLASVKQDYEMYAPLVRSGGIIAFHDAAITDHPQVEVYKLIRTIKRHIEVYQSDANGVGVLYV